MVQKKRTETTKLSNGAMKMLEHNTKWNHAVNMTCEHEIKKEQPSLMSQI